MKQITSRELQLNLAKYLNELPILITRYEKPVAVLVSSREWDLQKNYIKELEHKPGVVTSDIYKCEVPGCREKAQGLYDTVRYDWEQGEVKEKSYFCRSHYEKYQAEAKSKGVEN